MVAESEDLLVDVGIACGLGLLLFLASFAYIVCYRHFRDVSELPHLQALIACHRIVLGGFILLLVPLVWGAAGDNRPVITPMTSYGNGSSWNFGWGRPTGHFALAFVGAFLDFHPGARLSCAVGMTQAVFLDTLSSYDLGTQIECVVSGRCALPDNHSLWGLRLLHTRDLASVALGTWALLLIGHLSLVIGTCRTRYSFRQLRSGDHNRVRVMRTELAKRSTRDARVRHHRDDDSMP